MDRDAHLYTPKQISIHSLRMEGDLAMSSENCEELIFQSTPSVWRETHLTYHQETAIGFQSTPSVWRETHIHTHFIVNSVFQSTPSVWRETWSYLGICRRKVISIHSLRMEGDSKTAQESVFHFAYPCTILQKRMQKTTFCTRKNDFFRKKGEKFGAKPPASFCAPMIRTDIFPQTSLTESAALPCLWFPLHRYVPPSTDNDFPGNKTAGCPFLYQSPVPADA